MAYQSAALNSHSPYMRRASRDGLFRFPRALQLLLHFRHPLDRQSSKADIIWLSAVAAGPWRDGGHETVSHSCNLTLNQVPGLRTHVTSIGPPAARRFTVPGRDVVTAADGSFALPAVPRLLVHSAARCLLDCAVSPVALSMIAAGLFIINQFRSPALWSVSKP
jgi:hypothetical protein